MSGCCYATFWKIVSYFLVRAFSLPPLNKYGLPSTPPFEILDPPLHSQGNSLVLLDTFHGWNKLNSLSIFAGGHNSEKVL